MAEITKCRIVNIHHGRPFSNKGKGEKLTYAYLVDLEGNLMISSTLDYILSSIKEREYELVGEEVPHIRSSWEMPKDERRKFLGIED